MNDATATAAAASFESALTAFVGALQEMHNQHYAAKFSNLTPPRIEVDPKGQKYVRIVKVETFGSGRSVYCFVEKETGNVLKPAGWKGPAKTARGNIYAINPIEGCGPYGVAYLK